MKKTILPILIGLISFSAVAQRKLYRLDYGLELGAANYLGDMGGKEKTRRDFVADLKLSQTHFMAGAFARYKVHPQISVKLGFDYARLSGDDKLCTNPGRHNRNLNFRNDIFELNLEGQFYFYEINDLGRAFRFRNDFRCYAFIGAAGFYNNPKTQYNGSWVQLQPLKTEGVSYSKYQFAIPTGVGFYFTMNKQYRIGWELGWRTTFTDYMDDVSTVYADPATLGSQEAIDLANRTDELGLSNADALNYTPGSKRGDPTHNDSYIFTNITLSYAIKGKSSFYKRRYSAYFKGRKYRKRSIRAKF